MQLACSRLTEKGKHRQFISLGIHVAEEEASRVGAPRQDDEPRQLRQLRVQHLVEIRFPLRAIEHAKQEVLLQLHALRDSLKSRRQSGLGSFFRVDHGEHEHPRVTAKCGKVALFNCREDWEAPRLHPILEPLLVESLQRLAMQNVRRLIDFDLRHKRQRNIGTVVIDNQRQPCERVVVVRTVEALHVLSLARRPAHTATERTVTRVPPEKDDDIPSRWKELRSRWNRAQQ
mmetsp:Transcript_39514/g.92365  ORF Transcript_39514/g.92365 Transcript_39514/m.92365 type:complete len:231 (+) Transcript_39514:690-1382(+)